MYFIYCIVLACLTINRFDNAKIDNLEVYKVENVSDENLFDLGLIYSNTL